MKRFIQAVSDGKHLLQTDTMYIIKNEGPQDTGHNATNGDPVNNAQGVPSQDPSKIIIPQTAQGVKPEAGKAMAAPASQPVASLIADIRAPLVRFSKRVDGTYYVVEAVPDSAAREFRVVSAYMEKASGSTDRLLNVPQSDPQPTSKTLDGAYASTANSSIPQTAPNVNAGAGKAMAAPASQPVDPLIADIRARGAGQTTEQGDKWEIFGKGGTDLMGKSAGEAELSEPGEPVQIGTVAADPKMVYHRFKKIETTIVAEMKWDRLIDPDLDGCHETMEILSRELGFHYERKSRSK